MEFFEKVRARLRVRNIFYVVLFLLLAALFVSVVIFTGFSSEATIQFSLGGSGRGIPIPNWVISCMSSLMTFFMILAIVNTVKSIAKDTEYNVFLNNVFMIGDTEKIGSMLSSIEKSKLVKSGELRFNEQILFYMEGTNATIVSGRSIRDIRAESVAGKYSETHFISVYYNDKVLKIQAKEQKILPLLDEMRRTYHIVPRM